MFFRDRLSPSTDRAVDAEFKKSRPIKKYNRSAMQKRAELHHKLLDSRAKHRNARKQWQAMRCNGRAMRFAMRMQWGRRPIQPREECFDSPWLRLRLNSPGRVGSFGRIWPQRVPQQGRAASWCAARKKPRLAIPGRRTQFNASHFANTAIEAGAQEHHRQNISRHEFPTQDSATERQEQNAGNFSSRAHRRRAGLAAPTAT
jgi:hypothetical protein